MNDSAVRFIKKENLWCFYVKHDEENDTVKENIGQHKIMEKQSHEWSKR